jgi:hypothetical protein
MSEESVSLEKDRARAIEAMREAEDRTLATWVVASKQGLSVHIDAPCHAGLRIPESTTVFASGFNSRQTGKAYRASADEEKPGVSDMEKYWSWMTGDNSPWKLLFEKSYPEKITTKKGIIVGFFLDPETAHEKFRLTYNYCIAMRMVGEERTSIKTWSKLVDLGMRESDALYLSRMIRPYSGKKDVGEGKYVLYSSNDSCHWPLTALGYDDHYTKQFSFNFERFRNGDFDFKVNNEVYGWCTSPLRPDFSLGNVPHEISGYEAYFKIEDVAEVFTKWVNEQKKSLIQKIKRKVAA